MRRLSRRPGRSVLHAFNPLKGMPKRISKPGPFGPALSKAIPWKCLGDGPGALVSVRGVFFRAPDQLPIGIECPPARRANELRKVGNVLTGLVMRHMHDQEMPGSANIPVGRRRQDFFLSESLDVAFRSTETACSTTGLVNKCVHGLFVINGLTKGLRLGRRPVLFRQPAFWFSFRPPAGY